MTRRKKLSHHYIYTCTERMFVAYHRLNLIIVLFTSVSVLSLTSQVSSFVVKSNNVAPPELCWQFPAGNIVEIYFTLT